MNIKYEINPTTSLTWHRSRPLTLLVDRVRTLTGKEIELDIEPDYKVGLGCLLCFMDSPPISFRKPTLTTGYAPQISRIKERVEEKEGIPPVQQRLIFGGKQMYVYLSRLHSFFILAIT